MNYIKLNTVITWIWMIMIAALFSFSVISKILWIMPFAWLLLFLFISLEFYQAYKEDREGLNK